MDAQLRRLEVAANNGDTEAQIRLYRLQDSLGMIDPLLSAIDMENPPIEHESNLCGGSGYVEACDCWRDECPICWDAQKEQCSGCEACLAPSIYYGVAAFNIGHHFHCIHRVRPSVHCPCDSCANIFRFRRTIEKLRKVRNPSYISNFC